MLCEHMVASGYVKKCKNDAHPYSMSSCALMPGPHVSSLPPPCRMVGNKLSSCSSNLAFRFFRMVAGGVFSLVTLCNAAIAIPIEACCDFSFISDCKLRFTGHRSSWEPTACIRLERPCASSGCAISCLPRGRVHKTSLEHFKKRTFAFSSHWRPAPGAKLCCGGKSDVNNLSVPPHNSSISKLRFRSAHHFLACERKLSLPAFPIWSLVSVFSRGTSVFVYPSDYMSVCLSVWKFSYFPVFSVFAF